MRIGHRRAEVGQQLRRPCFAIAPFAAVGFITGCNSSRPVSFSYRNGRWGCIGGRLHPDALGGYIESVHAHRATGRQREAGQDANRVSRADGPQTTTTDPFATDALQSSRTRKVPNDFVTLRISIIGQPGRAGYHPKNFQPRKP